MDSFNLTRSCIWLFFAVLYYADLLCNFVWWSLIEKSELITSEYDYIVVGGGSAGSVVAGRLAENGTFNVLLLEAGASSLFIHRIPPVGWLLQQSKYDWSYQTEPQHNACLSMNEQRSPWSMGRLLGGSSQLNFMLYMRGSRHDFDERWAPLNPGWSYDDVLPFYKRSVHYRGEKRHLGEGGRWNIRSTRGLAPVDRLMVDAASRLGLPLLDYNSQSDEPGSYFADSSQYQWYRHASNDAFLHSAHNLHVVTHATVDKVLFDPGSCRASAVQLTKFGESLRVGAKREIILSAGAINSPAILLRSGIGPRQHLQQPDITPVVSDLPVGENLQAHVGTMMVFPTVNSSVVPHRLQLIRDLPSFFFNQTGEVMSNLCNSGVLWSSSLSEQLQLPDLQLMLCHGHFLQDPTGTEAAMLNLQPQYVESMWDLLNSSVHGFVMFPYLLRPRSRGYVRLRRPDAASNADGKTTDSRTAADDVIMQPNFLQHPDDVRALVQGMKFAMKLAATEPLKSHVAAGGRIVHKLCRHLQQLDERLECELRHVTVNVYHPSSTCRMAPRHHHGVVDNHLRVYGVRGLRVMDASVLPDAISGNPAATITMVAEKGTDAILRGL